MGGSSMKMNRLWPKWFTRAILVLAAAVSMNVDAGLFGFGGDSWKEEALQYDGSKIIVKRSQSYGGRHEIGQPSPVRDQTVSFTLPDSSKTINFTSEYSEDIGSTNFVFLALHVLNGTPYIAATPYGCLAYNKWGRPNPPYVFFKYDGKEWQRIPLSEFPSEFKTVNLDFGMPWDIRDRKVIFDKDDLLSAETIKRHNEKNIDPANRAILREVYAGAGRGCEELVKYKGYWIMPNDPVARSMIDRKAK
jgi:hypothetical protein